LFDELEPVLVLVLDFELAVGVELPPLGQTQVQVVSRTARL
jgi:hypothetical protein